MRDFPRRERRGGAGAARRSLDLGHLVLATVLPSRSSRTTPFPGCSRARFQRYHPRLGAGLRHGEEAYSIAMLLLEGSGERGRTPGVRPTSISARWPRARGPIPAAIAADVSDERLRRFSSRRWTLPHQGRAARRRPVCLAHLLKDPPFSKLDLILCRNLLIYLDRELQQQACATFHYALNRALPCSSAPPRR